MQSKRFPENEPEESITQRWTNIMREYLEKAGYRNPSAPRVLDAACGELGTARALIEYFGSSSEIVAIDSDFHQAELARKKEKTYPNISVWNMRIEKLYLDPFYDGYFDVAITRQPNVRNCLDNWGQNYEAIGFMLKPGGYLLATFREEGDLNQAARMIVCKPSFYKEAWMKIKTRGRNEFGADIHGRDSSENKVPYRTDGYILVAQKPATT